MFSGAILSWVMLATLAAAILGGVVWGRHRRGLERRHTDVFVSRLQQQMRLGDDD